MAQNVNKEVIKLELQGFGKLSSVKETFGKLNKSLSFTPKKLNDTIKSITKFDQRFKGANGTSQRSVNIFKQQIAALKELQNNVAIGGKAYKAFGAEADRLRAKLAALTNTQKKQKFGAFGAGGVAAIGGAGAFIGSSLGISPAISGLASAGAAASKASGGSAIVGGLEGAAVGATIAAVAGGVQFARQAAIQASEVQKLRIALKGVTKDQATFEKGLRIISDTSKRLNVPIKASTKQFTTLSASVLGAGGTIKDAEEVFTGVSNAIKATGGNAEDVQSAIRAMSQIFGKGKVSAEELQGQLGERLAGAVVKFAEANGSSLQKLQKDLRDGTVGLDQVIKFAQKLNTDFAETAEKVANSAADSGQRLQTQIQNLSIEIGTELIPVGAALQKQFAEIISSFTESEGSMKVLIASLKGLGTFLFATVELVRLLSRGLVELLDTIIKLSQGNIEGAIKKLSGSLETTRKDFEKNIAIIKSLFLENEGKTPDSDGTLRLTKTADSLPKLTEDSSNKAQKILDDYMKSVKDVETQIANTFVNTFKKLEDSLVEFVQTGTLNFKKLAQSIISDITRIFIRSQIIAPLVGGLGNMLGFNGGGGGGSSYKARLLEPVKGIKFEKGGIMANNKIVPYAKGGLIDRPTIFPLATGAALAGEAGVEAIMPLRRGKDGKLGVEATSGGTFNVVVNVDASGNSVEGDSEGQELGQAIATAVQLELVKQKRSGGLLA
mgnify:CR=1 FL=1